MPWIDNVSAVLEAWYPGIRGADAIANILFGYVNPSAKLPLTFARAEADLPHPGPPEQPPPAGDAEMKTLIPDIPFRVNMRRFEIEYNEGLKVGYKWYDAEDKQPLFAFGYGLSYTSYTYSDLKVRQGQALTVTFNVKNTGARPGAEIAQVYVSLPASAGEPPKRLVGWDKVHLAPGEAKTVNLTIDPHYLSIFNSDKDGWELVTGDYKFWVGGSSRNLPLLQIVKIGD
jgi:beta-glucosidase